MRNLLTTLLLFIFTQSFSQSAKKISTYLHAQYNKTLSDQTKGNNPWGAGLGLQTFLNTKTKLKPTAELTGDLYVEDDKLLRLDPNSTGTSSLETVESMINLFAGAAYQPTNNIYFSFLAGPSFVNGKAKLGIKPSVGFYFSPSQKWTGKVSYINIFDRNKVSKADFSSVSVALGLRLF